MEDLRDSEFAVEETRLCIARLRLLTRLNSECIAQARQAIDESAFAMRDADRVMAEFWLVKV